MSSFFKHIRDFFAQHFSHATTSSIASDAHAAKLALELVTPGLVLALQSAGVEGGSAQVQNVVNEIVRDLGDVETALAAIQSGQPVPDTLRASLESLKTNLPALLADAHIKNAQTFATIQNTATAVINEVEVILNELYPAGQ